MKEETINIVKKGNLLAEGLTTNYRLIKPGQDDFYNVDDFNQNMDTIDYQIKSLESQIEGMDASWDSITGKPDTFPPSKHGHTASEISGLPTSLPASDVYTWAKQPNKPSYSAGEVGASPSNHGHTVLTGGQNAKLDLGTGKDGSGLNDTNNVDIKSWYGVSFSNSCPNAGVVGRPTASIDVRSGTMYLENDVIVGGTSLKQSVVNGKQQVVNAINGKLGYASGLTTNHAHSDYAWWITNKIPKFDPLNFYCGGCYQATPSGVPIKYIIYNVKSKSDYSSSSSGSVNVKYTTTQATQYQILTITTTHAGARTSSLSNPTTVSAVGATSSSFPLSSDAKTIASRVYVAIFTNPVYMVECDSNVTQVLCYS